VLKKLKAESSKEKIEDKGKAQGARLRVQG
jgi:hypothetical protein